ncbi:MAG TPA: hypothetical protein VMZ00_10280 [Sporichthya sp.]|nr:hypothetical protein [Sporichthya sp.]
MRRGWKRSRAAIGATCAALALSACQSDDSAKLENLAAVPLPSPVAPGASPSASPTPPTLAPTPLAPGEKPPQFVVVSFDGGGGLDKWRYYRDIAAATGAHMTYFLSGPYLVPQDKAKQLYFPPHHAAGASDIGWADNEADVLARMEQVYAAYASGDEIGTHFNGHFCGGTGVEAWSAADWASELDQFNSFLLNWRTNNDALDAAPLPFDLNAIIGERTPCLEGKRSNLFPQLVQRGFRYDTSGYGYLTWPQKLSTGLWDIPMQELRMAGSGTAVLSMDYNFFELQSGAREGGETSFARWQDQVKNTYLNAYQAVLDGNRAPLIIGAHFANWNGGLYHQALGDFMKSVCDNPETRCVSFKELVDWLDVQTSETLAMLQALPQQPMGH